MHDGDLRFAAHQRHTCHPLPGRSLATKPARLSCPGSPGTALYPCLALVLANGTLRLPLWWFLETSAVSMPIYQNKCLSLCGHEVCMRYVLCGNKVCTVLWGHEAHPASCLVELQQLECHIPYRGGCFPALLSFQPNHTAVWIRGMAHLSGGGLIAELPRVTARVTVIPRSYLLVAKSHHIAVPTLPLFTYFDHVIRSEHG